MSSTPTPISIRTAWTVAWPLFKGHLALGLGVCGTILGAWIALEILVIGGQRLGLVLWILAHVTFLLFAAGVEVGFLRVCLAICDGEDPTFADIFSSMALGPRFLAAQVGYGVVVLTAAVLLVIPGAYISARFALFGFCLAEGRDLAGSFRQSAALSEGVRWGLLRVIVLLLVLNALGACALGLGLFVTAPLSALLMAAVYRQRCPNRHAAGLSGRNGAVPA